MFRLRPVNDQDMNNVASEIDFQLTWKKSERKEFVKRVFSGSSLVRLFCRAALLGSTYA
jgi:hypothetical protein